MREIELESEMDSDVVLRRLYGRALEPETAKELARSLGEWRGLEAADRTFVLAHLARLQLEVLERVLEVVGEVVPVEAVVPDGEDAADDLVEDEVTEEVERSGPASRDHASGSRAHAA